jgi:hypothetical protein
MQVLKTPAGEWKDERGTYSILETMNVETGERKVLKKFDETVEAPNWTKDGKALIYNSGGRLYRYDLESGVISGIYTGAITTMSFHLMAVT